MKKTLSFWLALLLLCAPLAGCADGAVLGGADGPTGITVSDGGQPSAEPPADAPAEPPAAPEAENGAQDAEMPWDADDYPAVTGSETLLLGDAVLDEEGWYSSKEEVALYLMEYGALPQNYITKKEAKKLGWEGGGLDRFAPGCSIGGDHFGNYEGSLPEADGRAYTECDIGTAGAKKRGAKRIIFSDDGLIFYTSDHYETFTLLLGEE